MGGRSGGRSTVQAARARPRCVYLVQGSRETLACQDFEGAPFYTLCYEGPCSVEGARACLDSTTASWAAGRNLLLEAALAGDPDADYFVFCDDDVVFLSGGFGPFEEALGATRPAVGFPLMLKARLGSAFEPALQMQRAIDIDEQMYAVHRSVVGLRGIAPLETRYDTVSWYVSSMTFEYLVATRLRARAHQYNGIELSNDRHVWETGATLYSVSRGVPAEFVPVFAHHAEQELGGHDPQVIEQFMPPLLDAERDAYVAARRLGLGELVDVEGLPLADGGQTKS